MTIERIPTTVVPQSLLWDGDELVDVVGGWDRWTLSGERTAARLSWTYPFDQVVRSPSGRFHVLYTERRTKALVLDQGKLIRELNRSYYCAEDYDYPLAVGQLPDGREVIVHCPEHRNVLQIEELESGRRLTNGSRTPVDVFHSRLMVGPDGRHLLMAGWVWHPFGIGWVFDLEQALTDSSALDGHGIDPLFEAVDDEVESACWLDSDRVVLATTTGDEDVQSQLGVWSIAAGEWLVRHQAGHQVGTLIPCGDNVISLYHHPRLLNPRTGEVLAEWPEVDSGQKRESYGVTHIPSPPVALHPDGQRLAVAQNDHIAIIGLP